MSTEITTPAVTPTETQPVVTETVADPSKTQTPEPTKVETPVIPEKYDLKLSDGSQLDSAYLEKFSSFAKEKKLTQEQAQEFLGREEMALKSYADKQAQEFEQLKTQWVSDVKNDPEIGGEAFTKNVELAHRALEKFGTQKFIEELNQTGYGNHPELVRIFSRIGKLISEDKMVSPGSVSGGTKTYEDIFYGKQ